ncbi:MAG TPA: hypothetical protein VI321_08455 [Burkholderiales bacterium]
MTQTPSTRARILDSAFDYKPSFNTDIRKTFERARAQQAQAKADAASRPGVLHLGRMRKLSVA